MNTQSTKINLRKETAQKFRNILQTIQIKPEISEELYELEVYKNASTILGFLSMDDEIATEKILERVLLDKKALALPRIQGNEMDFHLMRSDIRIDYQIEAGKYTIREPLKNLTKLIKTDIDSTFLVLVPGRAFTEEGVRLGRGKGFYDVYFAPFFAELEHIKPSFAGLCYEFQILDELPREDHDIMMDYLITDKKIRIC